MKLPTKECDDLLYAGVGKQAGDFVLISNRITGHGRWSVTHELIVKYKDGKFYRATYWDAATENQDQDPWGHETEVDFKEVVPMERTVTVYEPIASTTN